ncbi:hypothetical protein A2311_01575 [candidate division WOR-1 bacterium RIFOXYB2_FULL_48_7]|uniref:Uncharacterized protein n=1 Tax=candidate division WOR-1 bacterium RIFOXYB2_FULL_48_7 TaxID=1802583 RepID=A0A1F4TDQ6_UNCSA|nr:MAG: hypothetical protein A2311_01575 [candidate division WOR-1 bacterium RIFOXYB2_FULL_48_7]
MSLITTRFTGRKCGTAFINAQLWAKMPQAEQVNLLGKIAGSPIPPGDISGRNVMIHLRSPIIDWTNEVFSLRLKGIIPDVRPDGTVSEHSGNGVDRHPFVVNESGILTCEQARQGTPEGGHFADIAEHEYHLADQFCPEHADHALAFGSYDGIRYQFNGVDHKLGFVVFGVETADDFRLSSIFKSHLIGMLDNSDFPQIGQSFGQALARFHGVRDAYRGGYIHRYLHWGNIGLIASGLGGNSGTRVILRDFESTLSLNELSPRQRIGYLFIDIAQSILLCQGMALNIPDYFGKTELELYFMQTYFGSEGIEAWSKMPDRNNFPAMLKQLKTDCIAGQAVDIVNFLNTHPQPFFRFLGDYLGQHVL